MFIDMKAENNLRSEKYCWDNHTTRRRLIYEPIVQNRTEPFVAALCNCRRDRRRLIRKSPPNSMAIS